MTEQIIDVAGLSRDFRVRAPAGRLRRTSRTVHAVRDLTFSVAEGAAVGYIGANGAGKSTTIKMLTGILVPTAGTARTCGKVPHQERRELAREIGVVFGQRTQLWWDLPLHESYRALAAVHRIPGDRAARRQAELVDRLDLGEFLDTPVRQLSLGQRIRGEIAAALLHSPRLLVLDEPTIGLDVLSKERLRGFLVEERAAHGTSLLLTTHDMDDVQRLTERVLVVDRGSMAFDGTLAGLVDRVGAQRVVVVDLVGGGASGAGGASGGVPDLHGIPGTELVAVEADGLRQRLAFTPGLTTAAEVIAAVSARATVRDVAIEEPDIEDVVRRLYLSQ
jgi:ABC-2 type transport system ATP-binding protein